MRPSAKYIRSRLSYNRRTGLFVWKWHPNMSQRFNGHYAGKIAGRSKPSKENGGIEITLDYKCYQASHLAWVIVTGRWPKKLIDHKNLSRKDNRFKNLREANHTENGRNRKAVGATWVKRYRVWVAQIRYDGVSRNLGRFKTKAKAQAAYNRAVRKYHGKFGRLAS